MYLLFDNTTNIFHVLPILIAIKPFQEKIVINRLLLTLKIFYQSFLAEYDLSFAIIFAFFHDKQLMDSASMEPFHAKLVFFSQCLVIWLFFPLLS